MYERGDDPGKMTISFFTLSSRVCPSSCTRAAARSEWFGCTVREVSKTLNGVPRSAHGVGITSRSHELADGPGRKEAVHRLGLAGECSPGWARHDRRRPGVQARASASSEASTHFQSSPHRARLTHANVCSRRHKDDTLGFWAGMFMGRRPMHISAENGRVSSSHYRVPHLTPPGTPTDTGFSPGASLIRNPSP